MKKTEEEIAVAQAAKMERFLKQHDLYDQFLAEDAQGKH